MFVIDISILIGRDQMPKIQVILYYKIPSRCVCFCEVLTLTQRVVQSPPSRGDRG